MASHTENQRCITKAVTWILDGESTLNLITKLAASEGVSRRAARRIARSAWVQIQSDIEQMAIANPEKAGRLLNLLKSTAA